MPPPPPRGSRRAFPSPHASTSGRVLRAWEAVVCLPEGTRGPLMHGVARENLPPKRSLPWALGWPPVACARFAPGGVGSRPDAE